MFPEVERITGSFMTKHGFEEVSYELTNMDIGNCEINHQKRKFLTDEK